MKKVKKDAPRQARRQRALDRFALNPSKLKADDSSGYAERKAIELASLKQSLGV